MQVLVRDPYTELLAEVKELENRIHRLKRTYKEVFIAFFLGRTYFEDAIPVIIAYW